MLPITPASWIEISKSALVSNAQQFKQIIGTQGIFAPVIKANAYGHGILEVAKLCQDISYVDWLTVGQLSDALLLRNNGIKKPILVIGSIDTDPVHALGNNIHLFIYDYDTAVYLDTLGAAHKKCFNIHIKIDTGLSRFGITTNQAILYIKKIQLLSHIKIVGIYSHFAESQSSNRQFTLGQLDAFRSIIAQLEDAHIHIPIKHVANSAATLTLDLPDCNLFRVGAGLYGLWPSDYVHEQTVKKYPHFSLKPVLRWKTRIMHIKQIPAHNFVGYNCTHYTQSDMVIGILPVGYYDGYDIHYSNKTCVQIVNSYAPIVGRVCMNHIIIDLTHISHARTGDEVTIIGPYPPISLSALAQINGTHNVRQVASTIHSQIPRNIVD